MSKLGSQQRDLAFEFACLGIGTGNLGRGIVAQGIHVGRLFGQARFQQLRLGLHGVQMLPGFVEGCLQTLVFTKSLLKLFAQTVPLGVSLVQFGFKVFAGLTQLLQRRFRRGVFAAARIQIVFQ